MKTWSQLFVARLAENVLEKRFDFYTPYFQAMSPCHIPCLYILITKHCDSLTSCKSLGPNFIQAYMCRLTLWCQASIRLMQCAISVIWDYFILFLNFLRSWILLFLTNMIGMSLLWYVNILMSWLYATMYHNIYTSHFCTSAVLQCNSVPGLFILTGIFTSI
jgi:hypothetical protein